MDQFTKAVVDHWVSKGMQMSAREYITVMARAIWATESIKAGYERKNKIELLSDIGIWLANGKFDMPNTQLEMLWGVGINLEKYWEKYSVCELLEYMLNISQDDEVGA